MEREPLIYVQRSNTDCCKWDGLTDKFGQENLLPLWVADMDFQAPACVRQAVAQWAEHGVYGYYQTPERYYDAFIRWEREQHGYPVQREWLRFSPGIVSALYWFVQMLTTPGDSVALLTPVYYPFLDAIRDNGRIIAASPLRCDEGRYTIDYEDLERVLAASRAKLMIFSSPHNPVGRVWSREELVRVCRLCEKYDVTLLSDEIHQDLVLGDCPHIPTATLGVGRVATCVSASKTFNLAGLKNSCIILPDHALRAQFDDYVTGIHVLDGPSVGYVAAVAALEGGLPWLRSVKERIRANYLLLRDILAESLPKAVVAQLEGTYLTWIDLRAYVKPGDTCRVVQTVCGLAVDYGEWFGGQQWQGFIRINLATSETHIEDAARRLVRALTAE